jgi:hypothetical protein
MLRWAFCYLAMAVVVAIAFAALQESDPRERASVRAATEDGTDSAGSGRAKQDEVEDESAWEDESTWATRAPRTTRAPGMTTAPQTTRAILTTRAKRTTKATSST